MRYSPGLLLLSLLGSLSPHVVGQRVWFRCALLRVLSGRALPAAGGPPAGGLVSTPPNSIRGQGRRRCCRQYVLRLLRYRRGRRARRFFITRGFSPAVRRLEMHVGSGGLAPPTVASQTMAESLRLPALGGASGPWWCVPVSAAAFEAVVCVPARAAAGAPGARAGGAAAGCPATPGMRGRSFGPGAGYRVIAVVTRVTWPPQ